jgi:hypothetical protein
MRSCDYCGREALGEESDCRECGKALAKTSSTPTSADSPPDLQWIPLEGESSEQSHQLKSMRLVGWALILGSLAVLGGSYLFAASTPGGGYFLIPYGGIGLGIYFLQRPVLISKDSKRSLTLGDLMAQAGALEDRDRDRAISLYEEIVTRYPGTSQAEEASRNLAVLRKRPHAPTH